MMVIEQGGTVHRNFCTSRERWISMYMSIHNKLPRRLRLFIMYHSPRLHWLMYCGEYDYNRPVWTNHVQGIKPWWLRFNPKAFMDYKPEEALPRHEIQWGEWRYDN